MLRKSFNEEWIYKENMITLPHDAMLMDKRSASAKSGGGCAYFEGGIYEYRKIFSVPNEWKDKDIYLQFEGVYRKSKVYLNNQLIGGAEYGYIPFFVKLTNLLYGEENTLCVIADNSEQPNTRWYSGGGIYRPVWLWECEAGGLSPECVKITTLSIHPAKVRVQSISDAKVEILDKDAVVASGRGEYVELTLDNAKLWNETTPYLYKCRVTKGNDITEEEFGIRTITWSNKGLFINGEETLLRGGCIHHDNGILGAATLEEAEWRRVRLLKEAGYNALRIAHNPSSTALLKACDYYGMYVMDEAWDMWYICKNPHDYGRDFMKNYRQDLIAMVNRDYNHASVILYSIGNEITEPAYAKGIKLAQEMIHLIHNIDESRPVSGGMNLMIMSKAVSGKGVYSEDGSGRDESNDEKMKNMNSLVFNMITNIVGTSMNKAANSKKADEVTTPILDALDIAGYNYASGRYKMEGKKHPDRIIFGSETFPQDLPKNWERVKKYPYLIGDFMWTAWDYIGEAGGGAWAYTPDGKGFQKPYPWLLADMGAIDILGNPNGEVMWAQAVWKLLETPKMAVRPLNHPGIRPAKSTWRGTNALPSWSWKDCEGNRTKVEVYFDCARVELYLNDRLLAKGKCKDYRTILTACYLPGKLEAVCFDVQGREVGRTSLMTAKESKIQIMPEKTDSDICFVPIKLGDGFNVECNDDRKLVLTVENGECLGFGSANPRTEESFLTGTYTTYYGSAMAVIRKKENTILYVTDGEAVVSKAL